MTENRALKLTYIACIAGKAEAFFKAFAQTSYNLKKKYAGLYKVLLAEIKTISVHKKSQDFSLKKGTVPATDQKYIFFFKTGRVW